jgi:hypothetical protein
MQAQILPGTLRPVRLTSKPPTGLQNRHWKRGCKSLTGHCFWVGFTLQQELAARHAEVLTPTEFAPFG